MSASTVTLTTDEDLAMYHAIKKLAPDEGMELVGAVLYGLEKNKNGHAGVTVSVDWPTFLGCTAAELDEMCQARLAAYRAEQDAEDASRLRSERTKAGLARKMREDPDFKPGRQAGSKDKKPRKRSGYVARYERENRGSS